MYWRGTYILAYCPSVFSVHGLKGPHVGEQNVLDFFNRWDARSAGMSPENVIPALHTFDKIKVSKDFRGLD